MDPSQYNIPHTDPNNQYNDQNVTQQQLGSYPQQYQSHPVPSEDPKLTLARALIQARYHITCYRCESLISHSILAELVKCPVCTTVNAVTSRSSTKIIPHEIPSNEVLVNMTQSEVVDLAIALGCDQHVVNALAAGNIDGHTLYDIKAADLVSLGVRVSSLPSITRLLEALDQLRNGVPMAEVTANRE